MCSARTGYEVSGQGGVGVGPRFSREGLTPLRAGAGSRTPPAWRSEHSKAVLTWHFPRRINLAGFFVRKERAGLHFTHRGNCFEELLRLRKASP